MSSSQSLPSSSLSESSDVRRVTLVLETQKTFQENLHNGYRMKVTATAENMTEKIFRYLRGPLLLSGQNSDTFSGVCTAFEIEDLPEDSPEDNSCPQQFRRAEVDIIVPGPRLMYDSWVKIQADVRNLLLSLKAAEILHVADTATIEV